MGLYVHAVLVPFYRTGFQAQSCEGTSTVHSSKWQSWDLNLWFSGSNPAADLGTASLIENPGLV